MLIEDKDILAEEPRSQTAKKATCPRINTEHMYHAWGDAFDYYLRGITERYLKFHGRATRLEFWGFFMVSGIILIPLYILAVYIEMPMLPYYYVLATLLPSIAVAVRRLHDINKKATPYFASGIILALSAFFIQWYALILLGLWSLMLIRLWSKETDISDCLYGLPDETDEVYGDDNIRIIKRFRLNALLLFVLWSARAMVQFDDWSRQVQQIAANDSIMEQIEEVGQKSGLSAQEIEKAKGIMRQTLKSWNGRVVPEDDINKGIANAVKNIMTNKETAAQPAAAAGNK